MLGGQGDCGRYFSPRRAKNVAAARAPATNPDIARVRNLYEPLVYRDHDYKLEMLLAEIKAAALSRASDRCQVQFNKAFMRILVNRLAHADMRLSER